PDVPGSLMSEIEPTGKYMQAIWARLHASLPADVPAPEAVVHPFPTPPRRFRGIGADTPDPWVTLIYGVGIQKDSVTATWVDAEGGDVDFSLKGTRWGADWTRLHRLQPTA